MMWPVRGIGWGSNGVASKGVGGCHAKWSLEFDCWF